MGWKEFLKPTIPKVAIAIVLFFVLPTIMQVCDIGHANSCVWVIEWFFGTKILLVVIPNLLRDIGTVIYFILQLFWLVFVLWFAFAYLISCVIMHFATRKKKPKK